MIIIIFRFCARALAAACITSIPLSSTEAAIIYSGIRDEAIGHSSDASLVLTMGEATTSFEIRDIRGSIEMVRHTVAGDYLSVFDNIGVVGFHLDAPVNTGLDWEILVSGEPLLSYGTNSERDGTGSFFDQSNKFIAIQVLDETDMFFGWVRTSHSVEDEQLIVHDWAWNDVAGEPILAGQVPEPATAALLAGISALGIALFVRRRRQTDSTG